ncbi:MAG: response regulator [Thermodesulfobacteriota bacterium]
MRPAKSSPGILMVDDDPDDYFLVRAALEENDARIQLHLCNGVQELSDYLFCCGKHGGCRTKSFPSLILLDLNMPSKNGKEALTALKTDPYARQIPVFVYTNSTENEDIVSSYRLGANTYIPKPSTFESLVETMAIVSKYWLDIAILPFMTPKRPVTGNRS